MAERTDSWKEVQNLNPVRARVVGWQFGWTYHYPGNDGKFGRVDPGLISGTNDLGIDFEDPNAWDDFTSPILKIPVNRPAVLNIGSKDVIHNYSIVPMRIQQDAIPGREIPMWFTPIKTLETYVVCAQLCGEGHGNMVGSMEVVDSKAFDTWSTGQSDEASRFTKSNSPARSGLAGNHQKRRRRFRADHRVLGHSPRIRRTLVHPTLHTCGLLATLRVTRITHDRQHGARLQNHACRIESTHGLSRLSRQGMILARQVPEVEHHRRHTASFGKLNHPRMTREV